MPDLTTFALKWLQHARTDHPVSALSGAASEAGMWAFSRAHERMLDRGRLIWEDDWDICIVADACRWDLWKEVTSPDPDWPHEPRQWGWSVGSCSPEWYGHTFTPDALPDDETIGVVTANPFAAKPAERMPHLLQDATPVHENIAYCDYVFEESWGCEVHGGYLDVTHPGVVTDHAYAAWTSQDLDRLVVHYMQPHIPFRAQPEWFGQRENLDHFGEMTSRPDGHPYATEGKEIWKRVRDGEKDRDAVWTAYCDNLVWALEHIDRLRAAVDVDLLLTSDHGNGIGEWGIWSHPPGIETPHLRKVPWVHVAGQGRGRLEQTTVADADVDWSIDSPDDNLSVDDRLEALGYR